MAAEALATQRLPDLEQLLAPISVEKPSGQYLRYENVYDEIREARREEDPTLPQGVWKKTPKKADWAQVARLCLGCLERNSKDLQLAAWLTEAWVHSHGFSGANHGAELVRGLCEGFWDDLYPSLEEGDSDARLGPLQWMDQHLPMALKRVPVTSPGTDDARAYTWSDWELALHRANQARAELAAGRGTDGRDDDPQRVDQGRFLVSVSLTPSDFFLDLDKDLQRLQESLTQLVADLDQRLGKDAPSLTHWRTSVEQIQRFLRNVLRERLVEDEEMPAPTPGSSSNPLTGFDEEAGSPSEGGSHPGSPIRSRAEAYRRLAEAADYLARTEPHSPTPHLVRRAVSWGSMTVAELLKELLADNADLPTVFKLLGIYPGNEHR